MSLFYFLRARERGYGRSWCVTYFYDGRPEHQTFKANEYEQAHAVAENLTSNADTHVTNVRLYKEMDI